MVTAQTTVACKKLKARANNHGKVLHHLGKATLTCLHVWVRQVYLELRSRSLDDDVQALETIFVSDVRWKERDCF